MEFVLYSGGRALPTSQLTGPDASVKFDAKADDLGMTAVRHKANAAGDQRRVDVTHLGYVRVRVALKYLHTHTHTHMKTPSQWRQTH